jgi:hypothetical protein
VAVAILVDKVMRVVVRMAADMVVIAVTVSKAWQIPAGV